MQGGWHTFRGMQKSTDGTGRQQVANWLLLGVGMIMIQVLLGGITRLTGSGLSITEWKPILGTIPPMNQADWEAAFAKYREIGQFKHLNFDFTLDDFKFIYFWEWFHRVWARFMGLVFLFPFVYFAWTKKINRQMMIPMIILFLLGALQGALGWIMVQSGLGEDKLYVSHIRLAIHFMAALGLLCYVLWFALQLKLSPAESVQFPSLRRFTWYVLGLLILQLVYGAFMAGLKAGSFAPTWPSMNQQWWPAGIGEAKGGFLLTDNPITVQFIHRALAYLLVMAVLAWYVISRRVQSNGIFRRFRILPPVMVLLQLILGIFTVLHAGNSRDLLWWGVAHQFVAMLLLVSVILNLYLLSAKRGE
jgi:cytochrome c oxidase assembly protein subunit 15